jgi:predicted DsbA family dithiol-disulfide isomerase
MNPPAVRITYYLEIISSWCHWAEPAWRELQARYTGRVAFEWRIALMPPEAFPVSHVQTEWYYRRSGTIMRSPYMLNSGWFDPACAGNYDAPNLVAEAGRDFLAITHAAVREGRRVGDLSVACEVAAAATGLSATALREAALSPGVRERVDASTAAFHALQISQRPAFVLESSIGDRVVFSVLARLAPLTAAVDALLDDCAAYASHAAHYGSPPSGG